MILLLIADGRSIHTQRWAEYFARLGHEVHLVTYDPMDLSIPGVTEYVLTSRWENLYLSFWPRHIRLMTIIRRVKPDLIHAHFISKYGFHLPFLGTYPRVVSAWGDDILVLPQSSWLLHLFTKLVLSTSDLIYAVSGDIRTHIIRDFSMPEAKVKYFPFGVDTKQFHPVQSPAKKDALILFSNRGFLPIYGMDVLIEAFFMAYATNPRIRLILKGEGSEKERLQDLVRQKGMGHAVTFLDKTAYSDVPRELREADIFITPAGRDGTPVSLLEAMSSGLPCIATAVGGIPEWIEEGKNGMLVPPWDARFLADRIIALAGDAQERDRLGKNARKTIEKRGDWDMLMQGALQDYERLVNIR